MSMQIFVQLPSTTTIRLDVESSDSVESVKQKIEDSQGIPPAQQSLSYNGTLLADGQTLADYQIHSGAILQLALTQTASPTPTASITTSASNAASPSAAASAAASTAPAATHPSTSAVAGTAVPAPALPATGAPSWAIVESGVLLIAFGFALVGLTSRLRRARAERTR